MKLKVGLEGRLENTFLFLILLFLFKPVGFGQIPLLNSAFQWGKGVSIFLIFLMFCRNMGNNRISMVEISLGLFWTAYAVGCIRSESSLTTVLNYSLTSFALITLFRIESTKGRLGLLVETLWLLFVILITLQAISVFVVMGGIDLFPGEYTRMYLFGEDNYSAFAMLPMMAIVLYVDSIWSEKSKFKHVITVMVYLLILISYIYVQSVAAILGFALLGACYFAKNGPRSFANWLRPITIVVVFLSLLILVTVFHVQDYIAKFTPTFLDKDMLTLNSRTIIWDQAFRLIMERPIFGWGDGITEEMIWNGHAHNLLLDLLIVSGMVGSLSFLAFVHSAYTEAGQSIASFSGSILTGAFGAMSVMSFFDFYIGVSATFCFVAFVAVVPSALAKDQQREGLQEMS